MIRIPPSDNAATTIVTLDRAFAFTVILHAMISFRVEASVRRVEASPAPYLWFSERR
jgi:hypothetical protein